MPVTTRQKAPFEDVADDLRRRIATGQWKPGSKLPTWSDMTREFSIARPTLMRAMERLRQDGFIYTKSTRGTFVSENPPHLRRFGLVFPSHPAAGASGSWNRFWDTLVGQTRVIERALDVELPIFFDVSSNRSESFINLMQDIEDQRFAGLILVGRPDLMGLEPLRRALLPKIAIYGASLVDMPRVFIDHVSFMERSLDYLCECGARSVAMISNNTDRWEGFAEAIEARGLDSKPFWRLAGSGQAVTPLVRLLFDPDNSRVPDSLIIADDNIVEYAIAGLVEANVRVPDQVRVITHCNWPAPVPSPMPVTRLGFDAAKMLRLCVEQLRRIARGEKVETVVEMPATFESQRKPAAPRETGTYFPTSLDTMSTHV